MTARVVLLASIIMLACQSQKQPVSPGEDRPVLVEEYLPIYPSPDWYQIKQDAPRVPKDPCEDPPPNAIVFDCHSLN